MSLWMHNGRTSHTCFGTMVKRKWPFPLGQRKQAVEETKEKHQRDLEFGMLDLL